MKGGGKKKQELRRYNLFQLLEWYLNEVELQEERSLQVVIKLIESNREWSQIVQDLWQQEVKQV